MAKKAKKEAARGVTPDRARAASGKDYEVLGKRKPDKSWKGRRLRRSATARTGGAQDKCTGAVPLAVDG